MSDQKEIRQPHKGMKSLFSVGGLVLILVILVLLNLIFSQINFRWDVTEANLYSLSKGTKKILSELKQDVIIKVFYTKDNINTPLHIKTYAKRLLDFLDEYEYYSDGKVRIEIYSPQPDSEEEDWARRYGMEGINLPTGEKFYFGLVAVAADQEETIPTIDPSREEHLEYDITRIISRIQSPRKRHIGIISALPVFGQPPNPYNTPNQQAGKEEWVFVQELKKAYDVEEISMTADAIPDDIDLLLILHPKGISEILQYAVDQYVLNGGNVIAFVDPFSTIDPAPAQQVSSSSLDKLFPAWGIQLESGKVVMDMDYATKLQNQHNQIESNPLWISIQSDTLDAENITTAQLEKLLMPLAGAIKKAAESKYEYEPLIQSSENSSLTEAFAIRFGNTAQLRRDFKASVEKYDLAVRVRGKFSTAFPDGKPEVKDPKQKPEDKADKDEYKAEHLTEGKKESTIIIAADSDLLFDNYYVSRQNFLGFNIARIFNDNLNFLLNSVEILTGNDALISIRSRGKFERPFTTVQEIEKNAQERWLVREQELVREAEETNRKLRELEKQKDNSQQFIMTKEQEEEIQKFQEKKLAVNKELKEVRRKLRADIERLGTKIKFVNIVMMPFLVAIGGIAYGFYRRKKGLTN